jgi:hypothetical protein
MTLTPGKLNFQLEYFLILKFLSLVNVWNFVVKIFPTCPRTLEIRRALAKKLMNEVVGHEEDD